MCAQGLILASFDLQTIFLKSIRLFSLIIVIVAFFVSFGCSYSSETIADSNTTDSRILTEDLAIAPDFTLIDQFNGEFTLSQKKGDVVLLFFGYTLCPDICPTTLVKLNNVVTRRELEGKVDVILITVDPGTDTPERLYDYISRFNSSFIGLTGESDELKRIQADYGVYSASTHEHEDAQVDHSSYIYLINREGYLVGYYDDKTSTELLYLDLIQVVNN